MSQRSSSNHAPDVLDELASQLLACGAVLSQIISDMVRTESAGRSAPDAAPVPVVAHGLIRDVMDGLRRRYTEVDIRLAASIVGEATDAICSDIFLVDPDFLADPELN